MQDNKRGLIDPKNETKRDHALLAQKRDIFAFNDTRGSSPLTAFSPPS
jgi:hypothetical protein